VVVNPFNGPGGRPILPDEKYQRSIAELRKYRNVSLLGYIHALYGKRDERELKHDIDIYHKWHEESLARGEEMGVDGVFIDEVDHAGHQKEYFKSICTHAKSKKWRTGRNGIPIPNKTHSGYVVLNPGCDCSLDYFDFADLIVLAESSYKSFINPPWDHPSYSYLRDVPRQFGLNCMLPKFSRIKPAHKTGVVLHTLGSGYSEEQRLDEMEMLVRDLVGVKRVGAIFLTNLEMDKENVYGAWSLFWREFTEIMASASLPN